MTFLFTSLSIFPVEHTACSHTGKFYVSRTNESMCETQILCKSYK